VAQKVKVVVDIATGFIFETYEDKTTQELEDIAWDIFKEMDWNNLDWSIDVEPYTKDSTH
jgi:hypothetical protein